MDVYRPSEEWRRKYKPDRITAIYLFKTWNISFWLKICNTFVLLESHFRNKNQPTQYVRLNGISLVKLISHRGSHILCSLVLDSWRQMLRLYMFSNITSGWRIDKFLIFLTKFLLQNILNMTVERVASLCAAPRRRFLQGMLLL